MLRTEDVLHDDDDTEDALAALQDLELSLRGRRPPANLSPQSTEQALGDNDMDIGDLRDLTHLAVWAVSTAKPGNGIEQILDGRAETYWQSDGPQPHTISAHFASKMKVTEVQLYLNYIADESYTPATLSVYAGCNFHDLRLVRHMRKLESPQGWVRIPMGELPQRCDVLSDEESESELGEDASVQEQAAYNARRYAREQRRGAKLKERMEKAEKTGESKEVTKTHMITVVIHTNHQNGRDSHVRMVRVLGPREQVVGKGVKFTSRDFQMYETIR